MPGNGERALAPAMTGKEKRPNWLLIGFVVVSLGLHAIVYLHMAGIYENKAISYIELSMHQISNPNTRVIPTPRIVKKAHQVSETKNINVKKFHIPRMDPDSRNIHKIQPSYERISLPEQADNMNVAAFNIPRLTPPSSPSSPSPVANVDGFKEQIEFMSAKDYFEMVNLRIHRFKKYPDAEKYRNIEGKVMIQFKLLKDGSLADLKVLNSSHSRNLDKAAVEAIIKASPFPKPPVSIFKLPVILQVSILFELV
ncbi:MAG: energy transducer TonB [Desulfobacteraceae bacterium]|nr:energy transducer TonB [Desulfobacteraceae bacterium]